MFSLSKHQAMQFRRHEGAMTISQTPKLKDNGINKIQQKAIVPKLTDATNSSTASHQIPQIKSQQNTCTKSINNKEVNQMKPRTSSPRATKTQQNTKLTISKPTDTTKSSTTNQSSPRATISLKQIKGLLCFQRTKLQTGQKLTTLIDTGANSNYISLQAATHAKEIPLSKPTTVKTIHGISKITSYIQVNIFSHDIKFLVLKNTGNFDLIFGMNGLKKINATLNFTTLEMSYNKLSDHIINKNHIQPTKSKIKKEYQKKQTTEKKPKSKATAKNPTISNKVTKKTLKKGFPSNSNQSHAKTISDISKEVNFLPKNNQNSKLDQKRVNINQNRATDQIDKTKPKFKMKLFLLERFLSDLQRNDPYHRIMRHYHVKN